MPKFQRHGGEEIGEMDPYHTIDMCPKKKMTGKKYFSIGADVNERSNDRFSLFSRHWEKGIYLRFSNFTVTHCSCQIGTYKMIYS